MHMKTVYIFCMILLLAGCRKFIEIPPPVTEVAKENIFDNDIAAESALRGIYVSMGTTNLFLPALATACGLAADELFDVGLNAGPHLEFWRNTLQPENANVLNVWSTPYTLIYYCNALLEGISSSEKMSDSAKIQMEGEAKLVRAFWHFYLVNMFGEVPLALTTDHKVNNVALRLKAHEVYAQVLKDLEEAETLMKAEYPAGKRSRPCKAAATAMKARVHLYQHNWAAAEQAASLVIGNASYDTVALEDVFIGNSREAIWQIKPAGTSGYTPEASVFFMTWLPYMASMRNELADAFSSDDKRRSVWVGTIADDVSVIYPFSSKYRETFMNPGGTEYSMVLRLAEQYLIRAEARIQQNDVSNGINDINVIRKRAGLALLPGTLTKQAAMLALEQERRLELFLEWGHRWFDLKRWPGLTGPSRADDILGPLKGSNWQPEDTLFPVPRLERENNPNLSQNNGY